MRCITPVPITGIGCICAAGQNLRDCTDSILKGERKAAAPVRFKSSHSIAYPVFEILEDNFSAVALKERNMLRTSTLGLIATHEALEDAGLSRTALQGKRVGVCIGTTVGSAMNNEDFYNEYRKGGHPDMTPITMFLDSNPAACIAREFNLAGPCQTVVNACSSGTDAVGIGQSWISSGFCDIVIAGGADELCRVTYNGFVSLQLTDDALCRPFDKDRKGLNLGEGAAVLILESEKSTRSRIKHPRAFILGYGSACDGYHLTAPKPGGEGLRNAVTDALIMSGKTVKDVSFINTHGTGTLANDLVESQVLHAMLPGIPFFSTKGYTGHTLGAAGAIEAAFTITCLEMGKIPASAGFLTRDPALAAAPVAEVTPISGSIALSDSLAFGGNNGVLILGKEGI